MIGPRTLFKIIFQSAVILTFVAFLCDWALFRIHLLHPTPAYPIESRVVPRVLAIPLKNGKVEYDIDDQQPTQTITCVHALFPHAGSSPCWYTKGKANDPIPMLILLEK
jgi:hypothetical protein